MTQFWFDEKADNILPLNVSASDSKGLRSSFILHPDKDDLAKTVGCCPINQPPRPRSRLRPHPERPRVEPQCPRPPKHA